MMKYLSLAALAWAFGCATLSNASVTSQTHQLVILQSSDLPELAQIAGQSMTLRSCSNGKTYLYLEQSAGTRLATLDVTDPARIRSVGTVALGSPSAFDFVRDLDDSTALISFRNNKGAAIVNFRKPQLPAIVFVEALRQAAHAEMIGDSGLLMVAQPRLDDDIPAYDFQVVDTSNPRKPQLMTTIIQVQQKLSDSATGATYLLGASGLTVIRQPRVEERHRLDATSN